MSIPEPTLLGLIQYGDIDIVGSGGGDANAGTGRLDVANSVIIRGSAESTDLFSGALRVVGGAAVQGKAFIGSGLDVTGSTTLQGDLVVNGSITSADEIVSFGGTRDNYGLDEFEDLVVQDAGIMIAGGAKIEKTLRIGSTINTSVSTGFSDAQGALVVAGGVYIDKAAVVKGSMNIGGTLQAGSSYIQGSLDVTGDILATQSVNFNYVDAEDDFAVAIAGRVNMSNTIDSTSSSTGALVIDGGVGIGKDVYVAGSLFVNGNINSGDGSISFSGTADNYSDTTDEASIQESALTISGGVKIVKTLRLDDTRDVLGTATTYVDSRAALAIAGGAYIGKSAVVRGNLDVMGNINSSDGTVNFTNATGSTSTTTGALAVTGGVGIGENLNMGGKLAVASTGNVGGSSSDASIFTAGGLYVAKGVEIHEYLTIVGFMDVSVPAGEVVNIQNDDDVGNLTLNVAGGVALQNNVEIGGILTLTDETGSTDSASGSFIIAGGAGIGENLYVGNNLDVQNFAQVHGSLQVGEASSSTQIFQVGNGGRLRVSNGSTDYTLFGAQDVDNAENARILMSGIDRENHEGDVEFNVGMKEGVVGEFQFMNGRIIATCTTDASDTTSGAVTIAGGVGIAKNLYVGGNFMVNGNINSGDGTINFSGSADNYSDTTDEASVQESALTVTGGVKIVRTLRLDDERDVLGTATTYTDSRAALSIAGGAYIGKSAVVRGNLDVMGNINSSDGQVNFSNGGEVNYDNTSEVSVKLAGGIDIEKNAVIRSTAFASDLSGEPARWSAFSVYGGGYFAKNLLTNSNLLVKDNIEAGGKALVTGEGDVGGSSSDASIATAGGLYVGKSVIVGGNLDVMGNINSADGTVNFTNATGSTSTSTGALAVTGGVGIGENLYVGGNFVVDGNINSGDGTINFSGSADNYSDTTDGATVQESALTVAGGVKITRTLRLDDTRDVLGSAANYADSRAALSIAGGAYIAKSAMVGADLDVAGTANIGANLNVTGSAIISQNVTITGDLTVNGTRTVVNTANLDVEDNFITVNSGPTGTSDAGLAIRRYAAPVPAVIYEQSENASGQGDLVGDDDAILDGGTADLSSGSEGEIFFVDGGNLNQDFTGMWIKIDNGVVRKIQSYNQGSHTATVTPFSSGTTDSFAIYKLPSGILLQGDNNDGSGDIVTNSSNLFHSGTVAAMGVTTFVQLDSGASDEDAYYNGMWLKLDDGVDTEVRKIQGYSGMTRTLNFSTNAFSKTFAVGTPYEIFENPTEMAGDSTFIYSYFDEVENEYRFIHSSVDPGLTGPNPSDLDDDDVLDWVKIHAGHLELEADLTVGGNASIAGNLKVDVINEYTADAGVTIEGVTIEDGALSGITSLNGNSVDSSAQLTILTANNPVAIPGISGPGAYMVFVDSVDNSESKAIFMFVKNTGNVGVGSRLVSTQGASGGRINFSWAQGDAAPSLVHQGSGLATDQTYNVKVVKT